MTHEQSTNFLAWVYRLQRRECLLLARHTAPIREVLWFTFLAHYGTDEDWCDG